MNLWESLLILLKEESLYGLLISLLGSIIIVVDAIKSKEKKKSLFTTFIIAVLVPLLVTRPIFKIFTFEEDFKPISYLGIALLSNRLYEALGKGLELLLSYLFKKENFNGLVQFLIQMLMKIQIGNSTKTDKKDDSTDITSDST